MNSEFGNIADGRKGSYADGDELGDQVECLDMFLDFGAVQKHNPSISNDTLLGDNALLNAENNLENNQVAINNSIEYNKIATESSQILPTKNVDNMPSTMKKSMKNGKKTSLFNNILSGQEPIQENVNGVLPSKRGKPIIEARSVKGPISLDKSSSVLSAVSQYKKTESISTFIMNESKAELCRVCLLPSEDLVSMFEKCPSELYFAPQSQMRKPDRVMGKTNIWYDDQTIRNKINFLSSVQVLETEELVSGICKPCLSDLLVSYRFKKRLEESDEILRKRHGLKNKTIVKTEFVLIDCDDIADKSASSSFEDDSNQSTKKRKIKLKSILKPSKKIKVEDVYSDEDADQWPDKYKYKCDECDRSFQYPSVLKTHKATHERQNKISKSTTTAQQNRISIPDKRGRVLLTPPRSSVIITSSESSPKSSVPEMSDVVDTSTNIPLRKRPLQLSNDTKSFKCQQCDRTFDKLKNMKVHESSHKKEKKYSCKDCPEQFSNVVKLHTHRKESHALRKCPECKKMFNNRLSFTKHVETHKNNSVIQKIAENPRTKSNTDLFKAIAPPTTTYWSDSDSD